MQNLESMHEFICGLLVVLMAVTPRKFIVGGLEKIHGFEQSIQLICEMEEESLTILLRLHMGGQGVIVDMRSSQ